MLIKQANPKSEIFVYIGIFQMKTLSVNQKFAMDDVSYPWCLWTLAISLFQTLKVVIIAVLLAELTKVKPQTYCKILIWPKKGEHYNKIKNYYHIKMGKEILCIDNKQCK